MVASTPEKENELRNERISSRRTCRKFTMGCRHCLVCLFSLFPVLLSTQTASAQDRAPQADNSRYESITTYSTRSQIIYGRVVLPDGSPPAKLVMIERVCKGIVQKGGFADSKGHFSFDLGYLNRSLEERSIIGWQSSSQLASKQTNPEDLTACQVRAGLYGYRSQSLALSSIAPGKKAELGTITLTPLATNQAPAISANDAEAPKNARDAYARGLDAAAKANWQEAIKSFEKATSLYPKYSSAWLSFGMLQGGSNNSGAALHSYAQAIAADEQFALPYIESAVLENMAAHYDKVLEHTGKTLQISPTAFPIAYLLNGWANLRLQHYDEAVKSALEGLKLDDEHRYPDLEFVAGMGLLGKRDLEGAAKRLEAYLTLAPHGENAPQAQRQLAAIRSTR